MTLALANDDLSAAELQAVATLWKRERRVLSTSFSGTSMMPAIAPGQPVTVSCGRQPVAGDVVVYQYANQLRVHRVVARFGVSVPGGWLLTWGDNNALPDEPASWQQVIGVLEGMRAHHVGASRRLLVRCLTWHVADIDQLSRRVALAYRMRAAWKSGPLVFAAKSMRALLRGRSPC